MGLKAQPSLSSSVTLGQSLLTAVSLLGKRDCGFPSERRYVAQSILQTWALAVVTIGKGGYKTAPPPAVGKGLLPHWEVV